MADAPTIVRLASSAALSDPGRVRTNNEDLAVHDPERGVFGVIDGVGGHVAGELAAAIARDVIMQRLARPLGTPAERVREAIAIANNEIYRRAAAEPELAGMTCVVTLALVADGRVTVGHVGDSRLYKLRPSGLEKLTHDHSPVGEREDAQEIGEVEAMRHPRRHEVFRDVGSALRDKDEPEYVEMIEAPLEDDAAILVCSDGLTDMIPSTMIDSLVREFAGDAAAVAAALVAAANEAGGRDNVTVVYAETPDFARAVRLGRAGSPNPAFAGSPLGAPKPPGEGGNHSGDDRRPGRFQRVVVSRGSWFVLGSLIGVLGTLLLAWRLSTEAPVAGRTIVAAAQASETVATLAAAVQSARAGDVIRLEPGTYSESVSLSDGVSLRARVPGASVFVRPPAASGEWVAIIATGDSGGSISGVRIASTAAAPIQVGVRISGHGRSLELLQVEGPVTAGVDLLADASVTLQGSHFVVPSGAVVLAAGSQLEASGNLFVHTPGAVDNVGAVQAGPPPVGGRASRPLPAVTTVAIATGDGSSVVLRRNVFAGFGTAPVSGPRETEREPAHVRNVVVPSLPSTAR